MMLAVMYGMMPSAKTESRNSAPPLNRLTSWNRPTWLPLWLTVFRQAFTAFSEIPGVGRAKPSRNTAMMNSVNSSFRRRSGVRNAWVNAVSMRSPLVEGSTSSAAPRRRRTSAVVQARLPRRSLARSQLSDSHATAAVGWPAGGAAALAPAACRVHLTVGNCATGAAHSSVTVPPAAVIFSLAVAENACAVTRSPLTASPEPSTLTSSPARTAPLAARSSGRHVPAVGVERGQAVQVDHLIGGLEPQVREPLAAWAACGAAASGRPRSRPAPGRGPWCPWSRGLRSCPWMPRRGRPGSWAYASPEPGADGGSSARTGRPGCSFCHVS